MAERVEDLNLPASVVTRIIKECLPDGVNVSKEARVAVARAASVFVLYLTSTSNNLATQANRKTISANDVFKALSETDFEFFVEPLKDALEAHKKVLQEKKLRTAEKSLDDKEVYGEINGKHNSSAIEVEEEEEQEEDN
ncbi:DNA polymerase epsilon subunit 3 [Halyomorpha halys]|uniref:DNA polymerase epsilon subunit 3 n=1 Tax=Halyomorpha halys TaxID=286706 RepID=UPI0006D50AE1|nr:DNA polymerase epsilon subunit 3 [Halyomorpha halys]